MDAHQVLNVMLICHGLTIRLKNEGLLVLLLTVCALIRHDLDNDSPGVKYHANHKRVAHMDAIGQLMVI